MHLLVTDQDGVEQRLEALNGWRAIEVMRDWGLNNRAECGGACGCITCHVLVDGVWIEGLPLAIDEEEAMLDTVAATRKNSRLSCQILMWDKLDGLKLELAPSAAR